MQVCIDQTKNSHRTVFSLIVWSKKKKKEGVSPEHDVTPMASDHLPLRLARLFLIFPSQLVKNKKKTRDPIMMSSRDLSLLRRALRYKRDMGEVSCGFFCVWACVRVIGVQAKNPIFLLKKKKLFNRQILSHWDRLPLELRQTIQWMADRQQAHDRLKRGWEKNTMSRLQRRLPILSSSTATKRRLRQVVHWFTPATLSTM